MQVLLQPFEEELYAPPVLIQLSYDLVLDKELLQAVTLLTGYVNEPVSILLEYPGLAHFVCLRNSTLLICQSMAQILNLMNLLIKNHYVFLVLTLKVIFII